MIVGAIFSFFLVFSLTCVSVHAQTEIEFLPTDKFEIPSYNGAISFDAGGTYENASLEENLWSFVSLHLDDSGWLESLNVSAKDSNLTITSIQSFIDETFAALLSYTVVGNGQQSFNLGMESEGGVWSVTFNDVFIAENDGWKLLPDNTIAITGASSNVTILYFIFPNQFGGNLGGSPQSVYEQHSVLIVTAVVVAVMTLITVIIRKRKQNQ
jgi:hypothetical protein